MVAQVGVVHKCRLKEVVVWVFSSVEKECGEKRMSRVWGEERCRLQSGRSGNGLSRGCSQVHAVRDMVSLVMFERIFSRVERMPRKPCCSGVGGALSAENVPT